MAEFIAEVCSNHNGSIDRALALIDKAAEIGCSGVKFQLFRIDSLFAPEALAHPKYREMLHARREWELPLDWLPVLKARCIEKGIRFGVTPFYVNAVEELLPFVDFYKVASYSLLHTELLKAIAKTGKPVVLSTGMAAFIEICEAINVLGEGRIRELGAMYEDVTILHCVSTYPTPLDQTNLWRFPHTHSIFGCKIGWSDHTVNPVAIYYSCLMNRVKMVEFHLDLDGQGREYGIGHCWLPEQICPVIQTIRQILDIDSGWNVNVYEYSPSEQEERLWRADPSDGLRPLMEMREKLR